MPNAALTGGQALSITLLITALFAAIRIPFHGPFFNWIINETITTAFTEDYFFYALVSG